MLRRYRVASWVFLIAGLAHATAVTPNHDAAYYLSRVTAVTLAERLEAFSGMFYGKPYATDSAIGEGPTGIFDRNPLERFDTFHCVSFLETVVALAVSKTPADFHRAMLELRYTGMRVNFDERTHFPELDWIPNGVRRGYFDDITGEVAGAVPLATATATIDRRAWYEFMTVDRLVRPDLPLPKRLELLDVLHARGKKYKPVRSNLRYLPFSVLFPNSQLKPLEPKVTPVPETDTPETRERLAPANEELFRRIPSGTIVNIVRPNWNITKIIGTRMNISHQGLLVWKDGVLYLRHAKPEPTHAVYQEPFLDYLRRAMMLRRSVDGIHLLRVKSGPR